MPPKPPITSQTAAGLAELMLVPQATFLPATGAHPSWLRSSPFRGLE